VFAAIEAHTFDDPADESRYKLLINELRCLVCQNQNIADSNAELAQDLRQQTYEMIQKGLANEEIVTYMVNRYGDFVLYRPPVKRSTILLWVGPFIILFFAIMVLIKVIRRSPDAGDDNFSDAQLKEAEDLLKDSHTTEHKS
jgi:cytochrome c-type biogenesis protein CcmH